MDLRGGQRDPCTRLAHVAELGGRGAKELSPHGRVEEQVVYFDGRARRTTAGGGRAKLAAGRFDFAAALALGRSAAEHQPADFGDRGQRLAAKPERANAEQVVGLGQFARGVAGQGQRQLVDRNAAAVIDHPDHFQPTLADRDVDPRGAGVDGVLHQLFHHARRPLDHLAGGDFVDQGWGKLMDGRHTETENGEKPHAKAQRREGR